MSETVTESSSVEALNFNELPVEIILEIFSYLLPTDVRICSLVCKKWLELIADRGLHKTTLLITNETNLREVQSVTENLNFMIENLIFKDEVDFSAVTRDWLVHFGDDVKRLSFLRCGSLDESTLIRLLCQFPNLKDIRICIRFPSLSTQFLDTVDLESVTDLNLSTHIWLDFSNVEKFVSKLPNLRHFGLWSSGITPVNDITKVIKCQPCTIKSLDLRYCRTNNATLLLEKLTKIEQLCLQELTINIGFIANDVVIRFFEHQTKIEVLQISSTTEIPCDLVFAIEKRLKKLRRLSIEVTEISLDVDKYLAQLLHITQLRNLTFEQRSIYESPHHNPFIFNNLPRSRLNSFKLVFFPHCSLPSMHEFCKSMSQTLNSLSLPSAQITNQEVRVIFNHLTRLRHLDLSNCKRITDAAIVGYTEKCQKRVKHTEDTLHRLKGLTSLELSGCIQLTDKILMEDYNLLDLRKLSLCNIPNLSLNGVVHVVQFKSLEVLDISELLPLTKRNLENTMIQLKEKLPRLKKIEVLPFKIK